ncbi:MAG: hypothetical protein WD648_16080 [Planctomycetaceae bacterium]
MPSQSSGPLTTFLMFVPLVAVPALAIFGIPEFAPVTALGRTSATAPEIVSAAGNHDLLQQSTDDLLSPVRNTIHGGGANKALESTLPASDSRPSDPFQQAGAAPSAREEAGDASESWTPPPDVLRDWDLHPATEPHAADPKSPNRPREFDPSALVAVVKPKDAAAPVDADASPFRPVDDDDQSQPGDDPLQDAEVAHAEGAASSGADELGDRGNIAESPRAAAGDLTRDQRKDAAVASDPPATHQRAADKLTWRAAVQRLNKLGIRDFQLQPSDEPNVFHFSCSYTEAARPRVSHRFEAEAEEPLQAVHKVLTQIEAMAKRP